MIPEKIEEVKINNIRNDPAPSTFYLGIGLLLVFIMAARSPLDTDMWWHLRSGEWMISNGQVLLKDIFSFTRFGTGWINHSWLAQVILFLFYKAGGSIGLGLFTAVIATVSMGLIYPRMSGHPLFKAGMVILLTPVAALVWSPRPQMFTLLLLAAECLLLYRFNNRQTKKIWLLVPLFILWSNLHGGYALGLLLIGAFSAGVLLDHLLGYRQDTISIKELLQLTGWTICAWASVSVNPNGFNAWLIPFRTVGVSSLQDLISEWASPDFHEIVQWPFLIVLFLCFFAIGNSRRRLTGIEFMYIVVFAGLCFAARRNYGPFAIVVGPVLTAHLWPAIINFVGNFTGKGKHHSVPGLLSNRENRIHFKTRRWINILLVTLLAGVGLVKLTWVSSQEFLATIENKYYPVGAVSWILENRPHGRMLSSYSWGGYLVWFLRDYPVFVDGRTDLYDDEIIQEWISVMDGSDDWYEVIDRWKIDLVLIETNSSLPERLTDRGWSVLFKDNGSVLLTR